MALLKSERQRKTSYAYASKTCDSKRTPGTHTYYKTTAKVDEDTPTTTGHVSAGDALDRDSDDDRDSCATTVIENSQYRAPQVDNNNNKVDEQCLGDHQEDSPQSHTTVRDDKDPHLVLVNRFLLVRCYECREPFTIDEMAYHHLSCPAKPFSQR